MDDYKRGFEDAMRAIGARTEAASTVMRQGQAHRAGASLAEGLDLPAEPTDAEIEASLGESWSEMGKDYPKSLALALIGKGVDPDDPLARQFALDGIRAKLKV